MTYVKTYAWNIKFSQISSKSEFKPRDHIITRTDDWYNLSEIEFKKRFKNSAVKRTKYVGLKRNIENKKKQ